MEPLPYIATYTNVPVLVDSPQPPEKVEVVDPNVFCNCWLTVKSLYYSQLPSMGVVLSSLQSNVSDVAVFYYPNSGLYHFAKVTAYTDTTITIDEGNFKTCARTQRTISHEYPHLIGFYSVKMSTD